MRVSMASWTHSALFPVSETCSISTVVNVVAAKYSGARLIRILRSRYFFSLFRLSGAATRQIQALRFLPRGTAWAMAAVFAVAEAAVSVDTRVKAAFFVPRVTVGRVRCRAS